MRKVISVGDRRDFPPEMWTSRDHAKFEADIRIGDKPQLPPEGYTGEASFSPVRQPSGRGVRSKGIDAWLEMRGIGRRGRRR